jgi:N-acetylglucosaminyl-diphospho-decaprenol L-rhamnosyltransferase
MSAGPRAAVDIVIVTADTRELTLACLATLHDPAVASITVVDNASTDGTAAVIAERFPDVRVVALAYHTGFAFACNRGAEQGSAAHVLFLNSDILATGGAIAALADALAVEVGAVAAGGRLVDPDSLETQPRYGPQRFPTLPALAVRFSGLEQRWPGNPWTAPYARRPLDESAIAQVEQPAGACLLVRRDVFERAGGFDERYWFWYEDVDLARRLHQHGRVLHVPAAVFRHRGGETFKQWDRERGTRSMFHGALHYAEQHFPRSRQVGFAVLVMGVSALRVARLSRREPDQARVHRAVFAAARALLAGRPVPSLI